MIFALTLMLQGDGKLPDWAMNALVALQYSGMSIVNPWGFSGRHGYPPTRWNSAIALCGAADRGENAVSAFRSGTPVPDSGAAMDRWPCDPTIVSFWSKQIPTLVAVANEVRWNLGQADVDPDGLIKRLKALRKPLAQIGSMSKDEPTTQAIEAIADLRTRGWLKTFPSLGRGPRQLEPFRQNYAATTAQAVREALAKPRFGTDVEEKLVGLIREFRLPLHEAGWLASPEIEDDLIFALSARQKGDPWVGEKYLSSYISKKVRLHLARVSDLPVGGIKLRDSSELSGRRLKHRAQRAGLGR